VVAVAASAAALTRGGSDDVGARSAESCKTLCHATARCSLPLT
jgi:hypothetical protein